jgi:hypothetical protein
MEDVYLGGASTISSARSGSRLIVRVAALAEVKMVNCRIGGRWLSIGIGRLKLTIAREWGEWTPNSLLDCYRMYHACKRKVSQWT